MLIKPQQALGTDRICRQHFFFKYIYIAATVNIDVSA